MHAETKYAELASLLAQLCDGDVDQIDWDRLERLLLDDPQAQAFYRRYIALDIELARYIAGPAKVVQPPLGPSNSDVVGEKISTRTRLPSLVWHGTVGFFSQEVPFACLIATVIMGIALAVCSRIYVTHHQQYARTFGTPDITSPHPSPLAPLPSPVARITGMVNVEWGREGLGLGDWGLETGSGVRGQGSEVRSESLAPRPSPLAPVSIGDRLTLASGLVQLTYKTGAQVILQGPCNYEVNSAAGGFLSLGKLTARVDSGQQTVDSAKPQFSDIHHSSFSTHHSSPPSPLAPHPSPLFTVTTPTAVITDLGTEFGVEVDRQGLTTSHVFRGSVRLQTVSGDGWSEGDGLVLHENESARVEQNAGRNCIAMLPTSASALFVQDMPRKPQQIIKTFDLVDVVAGGDGFSGRRGRGIDPTNGQLTDKALLARGETNSNDSDTLHWHAISDGSYHRVEALPLIDGVFAPNGRTGAVQVDSVGHICTEFGETDGMTGPTIWAGGIIPVPTVSMPPNVSSLLASLSPTETLVRTELGGVDYAAPGRGLVFLHANSGITFDLEAIRGTNPDAKLLRFRATAGNVEPVAETGAVSGYADLWVLVDGQVRFRRREINGCSGAFPISFPIAETDRFLTLAATDSGNTTAGDWILFGNPLLEMMTSKQKGE